MEDVKMKCATELFKTAMDCLKELAIAEEKEKTERERIRKATEIYIEQIRKAAANEHDAIVVTHQERMTFITAICSYTSKPNLTEADLRLCESMLDILRDSNFSYRVSGSNIPLLTGNRLLLD